MTRLTALIAAAAFGAAPMAALAQDTTTDAPAVTDTAPATFDDATLTAFVDAVVAIEEVRGDYEPRVQAAAEEERPALIEEANMAMVAAIESTDGLTLDQYMAVSEAASADEDLAARIVAMLPADMQPQQSETPEG